MPDRRAANLLGALVTLLHDEVETATAAAAAHGAAIPAALVTVRGEPGLSIDALRRILGLSHSGAVRLLDRLEEDGTVARKAGPDGRTVALQLTAAGRRQADQVQGARQQAMQRALGVLTPTEQVRLLRLVEKLLAGLTRDQPHCDHICRLCDLAACPEARCPVAQAGH